jgi:hypothetical protein
LSITPDQDRYHQISAHLAALADEGNSAAEVFETATYAHFDAVAEGVGISCR